MTNRMNKPTLEAYINAFGMEIYLQGICKHRNSDDDYDYIVFGKDGLAFVMRNQGTHDPHFFVVDLCETSKAIAKAKRLFN